MQKTSVLFGQIQYEQFDFLFPELNLGISKATLILLHTHAYG